MKTTKHLDEKVEDCVETRELTDEEMTLVVGGLTRYAMTSKYPTVSESPRTFRSLTIDPRLGGYVGGSMTCDCCTWEPAIG